MLNKFSAGASRSYIVRPPVSEVTNRLVMSDELREGISFSTVSHKTVTPCCYNLINLFPLSQKNDENTESNKSLFLQRNAHNAPYNLQNMSLKRKKVM